jgi:amidophosphoribosyltransferase
MSVEEVCRYIEADSLGYLSMAGMLAAIGFEPDSTCVACWNGKYPTPVASGQPTIDNS